MNRHRRRANAAANSADGATSAIPLSIPAYGSRTNQAKTLYEIAAERRAQLVPDGAASTNSSRPEDVKFLEIAPDGTVQDMTSKGGIKTQDGDTGAISPALDTMFLASSLSAVHFTLDVLTVHQYAEELRFPPIIKETLFVAFPTLAFAIHLFRGHLFPRAFHTLSGRHLDIIKGLQQLLFLAAANVAGCYLVHLTNDKGYYAVMKQAPSIGTVWVWCIVELGLAGALAGVLGPGIYAWYNEYGIL